MLTIRGWTFTLASLGALLLGLFTLNLLPLIIGSFLVFFVASELLAFGRAARTISPAWFRVERVHTTEQLNAGGVGTVELRLFHPAPVGFPAEVFDVHPSVFEIVSGSPRLSTWWTPNAVFTLAYAFRARARGAYQVGPVVVVVHDPLGFAYRTVVLEARAEVRVTPAAPNVSLRRMGLHLVTRALGATPVPRRGYGTEFRSLRPYQVSDDYRTIAWRRSTAGRYFVREFEQESRQDFVLLVSLSQRMDAGLTGRTALDQACEAGALLVQYVPRGGDRLGLLTMGDRVETWIPPSRGASHAQRITTTLTRSRPTAAAFDLAAALAYLARQLRQPTHVFAFTAPPESFGHLGGVFRRYQSFASSGHRLYLFTPELSEFYPPLSDPQQQAFFHLACLDQYYKERAFRTVVEREGIPVLSFDRQGASTRLLALYQRIHTWGFAR